MSTQPTEGSRLLRLDALALAILVLAILVLLADLAIHHTTTQRVLGAFLVPVLLTATVIDLQSRKIPNWVTLPAALLAIVVGALLDPSGLPQQAFAGLAAGGFLFIFAVIYPKGLGMGDVKLALTMGLYLSASVAVAMLAGLVASGVAGLFVIREHGVQHGRKVSMPLAPFLALGGAVAILAGPEIVHWYAQHQALSGVFDRGMTSSGR